MWDLLKNFDQNQQLLAFRTRCLNQHMVTLAEEEYNKAIANKLKSTSLLNTEKHNIIETLLINKYLIEQELFILEVPVHRHFIVILLLNKYYSNKI